MRIRGRVSGHFCGRISRRVSNGFAAIAAILLLTGGAAYALPRPPFAAAENAAANPCSPAEATSRVACVLQARGSMSSGGNHANTGRGKRTAKAPANPSAFSARTIDNSRGANRAMDGNVTPGPNVATARDINDRRATVSDNRRAILLSDGRVVALNDRRAVGLHGTSGVLIRLHDH